MCNEVMINTIKLSYAAMGILLFGVEYRQRITHNFLTNNLLMRQNIFYSNNKLVKVTV